MVINSSTKSALPEEASSNDKILKEKKEDPLLAVDGRGLNRAEVETVKEPEETAKSEDEDTDNDDFYSRLRNMYNKPLTSDGKSRKKCIKEATRSEGSEEITGSKEPRDIQREINTLTADVKRVLHKFPKDKYEKNKKPSKNEEEIKYKRSLKEDVECKTVHYDEPVDDPISQINLDPEIIRKIRKIQEGCSDSDENDPEDEFNKFPRAEDLPDDYDELEKIFHKYVDRMTAMAEEMKKKGEAEPGTKESVRGTQYKLDSLQDWKNPTQAVTGIRRCNCPEAVVIDGDMAELKDIKLSVKELKSNHNVGSVIVKMKKGDHKVDETVDSSSKLKEHKGPVVLTKYALEILSCQISKHPCLGTLVFENVPLPTSAQTLLIPAFANLITLRLIGTKLKDDGIKKLCKYLSKSKNLIVIDFTDNGITHKGAEKIAKLIEKKGFYKLMEPDYCAFERMTLNKNPLGAEGMKVLMRTLQADLFMKAVDLRECDIESTAAEVLDLIADNLDLNVLDLRGNRVQRVDIIIKSILQNCPMEKTVYKWENEEEIKKYL